MNKKSGSFAQLVKPTAPKEAFEADVADPGELEKLKREQQKTGRGRYAKAQVAPFKPPEPPAPGSAAAAGEEPPPKLSWIEIELVDEADRPVPSQRYVITLPDGTIAEGTLSLLGKARVEGFEPGSCKVTFPDLDEEAWEPA